MANGENESVPEAAKCASVNVVNATVHAGPAVLSFTDAK